jgi:MoxR-like ATPase
MDTTQLLTDALALAPKIRQISNEVVMKNIGRQDLITVTWLGLISGRPVFALGPTGVNKTATIRQMAERVDGAVFDERLIPGVKSAADLFVESTKVNEAPQPDGSKDISLKETLGRAARANIFFGDEFFKDEEHPVLDEMIDFALEGTIRHEGGRTKTPLMLFIAAGNETPDPQGRLAAVWSRMTLRLVVESMNRAERKAAFVARSLQYQHAVTGEATQGTLMTLEDIRIMRDAWKFVEVPESIQDTVLDIYDELANQSNVQFGLLGDDRRYLRIYDVMRAHALMQGRSTVGAADLGILKWMLWDEPGQLPVLREVLIPYTRTPLTEAQELVNAWLSPSGALVAAKGGNISKGVEALSQGNATVSQLNKLCDEAQQVGEIGMVSEIQSLCQQVQTELEALIAKMTGRA